MFWQSEFYYYYTYCYYRINEKFELSSSSEDNEMLKSNASKILLGLICSTNISKKYSYKIKKDLEKLITTSSEIFPRTHLINFIKKQRIPEEAHPEVKQLFDYFFNSFELFEFNAVVKPLLEKISLIPGFGQFRKILENAFIYKIIQECS